MGYNFNLLPKQNNDRLLELNEIENVKNELSKNDIICGTNVLERAIIYNNQRDP